jgi:hypothetical protein
MLILLNFSSSAAEANISLNTTNAKLLLCNYKDAPGNDKTKTTIKLRPYEAIVYGL